MKSIINNITLTLMALSLIACDSVDKQTISAADDEEIITDSKITSTSQLVAPKDMKFISHKSIKLAVDITNQGGGPAYLSVYSNYQHADNNSWEINHDSRILASSMASSQVNHDFATPQHLKKLLVQIWFYDGRSPLTKEVEISHEINLSW